MVPALARNVEHRNLLLQRAGGVLSAEDAGKVAGVTRQAIDERRRGNAILAVREGSDWKYPACQFRDGEVLAGIAEVVRGLADQGAWATLDGEGGGLPGELGAVAPGYQAADLCLLNEDTTYLTPLNRPVASFVFSENGARVDTVIVGGEIVVQSGQCTKIDERAIRRRAREAVVDAYPGNPALSKFADELSPHIVDAMKEPFPVNRFAACGRGCSSSGLTCS